MEAQSIMSKMSNDRPSLEDQKKLQLESLTKNRGACECCEYYGTPCRQSNLSKKEATRNKNQLMDYSEDEEATLDGYAHEDSLLSKAQRSRIKEEEA